MVSGSDGSTISVTRLTVPLVLICGVLAGAVALPFVNLLARMERIESALDSANYDALVRDVESLRREAIIYNSANRERHNAQQRTVDEHREGVIEAFRTLKEEMRDLRKEQEKLRGNSGK